MPAPDPAEDVLKIMSAVSGEGMVAISVVEVNATFGNRTPLCALLTSNMALVAAGEPELFILTCANNEKLNS